MASTKFPEPFDQASYIEWHEETITADKLLAKNLSTFMQDIKQNSRDDLRELGQLLTCIATHSQKESSIQTKKLIEFPYTVPLLSEYKTAADTP